MQVPNFRDSYSVGLKCEKFLSLPSYNEALVIRKFIKIQRKRSLSRHLGFDSHLMKICFVSHITQYSISCLIRAWANDIWVLRIFLNTVFVFSFCIFLKIKYISFRCSLFDIFMQLSFLYKEGPCA